MAIKEKSQEPTKLADKSREEIIKETWINEIYESNEKIFYAEDYWMQENENQFVLMEYLEQQAHFKFVITDQEDITGQITNQIGEMKEDIILKQRAKKKKKNEDDEYFDIYIGDFYDGRRSTIIDKIKWRVYKYLFITKECRKIILLSPNKLDVGEYMIKLIAKNFPKENRINVHVLKRKVRIVAIDTSTKKGLACYRKMQQLRIKELGLIKGVGDGK